MAYSLINVNDQVKSTLESLNSVTDASLKQYISNSQSQMKSRVEETKSNIQKYDYNGIVGNLAGKYQIDKYLILGIIATESNGNPDEAPSESGFWGCMQTSRIPVSESEFKNGDSKSRAQWGIEMGCTMFKEKYDAVSGSLWATITAYNAGEGTVLNALGPTKLETSCAWKDGIPYIIDKAVATWGESKRSEVALYALNVMFAYTYFAGYNVTIANLPQPGMTPASQNKLSASYNSPAAQTPQNAGSAGCQHGDKHTDTIYKAPDKLYCEPVYPDYVSVKQGIPEYALGSTIKEDKSKVSENGNLTYENKSAEQEKTDLEKPAEEQKQTYINIAGNKVKMITKTSAGVTTQTLVVDQLKEITKEPTTGKPVNNSDPFPVDSKIEEFELHTPRCKINRIVTCPDSLEVTKATMQLSMNVEKRLIRIENNISTMLRYLARYGSRVMINCQFFGGSCVYQKYKCIRCLRDDRLSDGQMVQFDQCLNCTRYEPIIGQVYDILDEGGNNLSITLDNNQMSYSNMEDYTNFSQGTKHQKEMTNGTFDTSSVGTRDSNDKDFDWTDGQIMKWNTVPVEEQVPHINKYQDINGTEFQHLSSYPNTTTNTASGFVAAAASGLLKVKQEMDKVIGGEIISQLITKQGG